jgi:Ni/Fe-hydrogenase subunit HybB-like protein
MEVLEKVVVAIFKSPQLRDVLLYATLLLIFATAWVSYRWPAFATPAIVIACALLSGGALLIYLVVKRSKAPSKIDGSADGKHS